MKHIAFFLPSLHGGGAERIMVTLANGFADRGHKVDLVVGTTEGPYLSEVSGKVRVVSFGKPRVLACLFPLAKYLRRERPDSMLSAMTHANIIAIWARKLAGVDTRLTVSEHSAPSRNLAGGGANRVLRMLVRYLYVRADAIISVSQGIQQELASIFRLPQGKLAVIYNPIDIEKIRSLMKEPVSHPWLLRKEVSVILAAGRLSEAKDYPLLLHAFALLRAKRPARLIILGQGEEEAALKNLANKMDLNADILFAGFQSNPYAWMHRCDAYIMSSAWEGLPGVLIEALACGAQVVSTDCPTGPREILEDGKWGTLVPTGDPQALAQAMEAALNKPIPISPEQALSRFRIDAVLRQYIETMIHVDRPG